MNTRRSGCRGTIIPLTAVMLFGFLVVAALAIDVGVFYTARTSSQHASDAAALAGAYTFLNPLLAADCGAATTAATQAAIAVAAGNTVLGKAVTIAPADVTVDCANRRVTVTARHTGTSGIATFFGRITGTQSVDVVTTATAQAALAGTGSRCVKPFYLPNTVLSPNPVDVACANNEVMFDANQHMTDYASARFGQQISVRPSDPAQALAPGQFYSLDFGSGGKDYRCSIGYCLSECPGLDPTVIRCGDSYPLKTGDMVGPTRQGIDDLTGGNSADIFVAVGQYQDINGQIWDTSRSLALAPVWDNCHQPVSPGYAGQRIQVMGFAMVFIDGIRGNEVVGHLVGDSECSPPGGGGGGGVGGGAFGDNTGPMARPVQLVNP